MADHSLTMVTALVTVSMVGIRAGMIDRAAIFAEVLQRNTARRHGWLPPLNVRAEFERAVAIAINAEVCALAELPQHQAVLARIIAEVTAKLGSGPDVGQSWGGRYFIGHETSRRFWAYMRAVCGSPVPFAGPCHPVRYGGGAEAPHVEVRGKVIARAQGTLARTSLAPPDP